MEDAQRGFELLQASDANGLRHLLEQDPAASEACDAAGVSLLMHSIYRGRRDLAELIASKKKALDIFEAASLGRLDRLQQCLRDASVINSGAIDSRSIDSRHAAALCSLRPQPRSRPSAPRKRSPRQRSSASRMGSNSCRRSKRRSAPGGTAPQAQRRSQASQRRRQDPSHRSPRKRPRGDSGPAGKVRVAAVVTGLRPVPSA